MLRYMFNYFLTTLALFYIRTHCPDCKYYTPPLFSRMLRCTLLCNEETKTPEILSVPSEIPRRIFYTSFLRKDIHSPFYYYIVTIIINPPPIINIFGHSTTEIGTGYYSSPQDWIKRGCLFKHKISNKKKSVLFYRVIDLLFSVL